MDVAVTGSSGFIGQALRKSLEGNGHRVIPIVRDATVPDAIHWDPTVGTIDSAALEGLDAVVHLAGHPIAAGRWSKAHRTRVRESREFGTLLIAEALAGLNRPPATLLSASAIGYYGDRGDEVLTEASEPGDDFLAGVCVAWEASTLPAASAGVRVVRARTGIVLDADGGALAKQLPIFRLGLGGRAGKGAQWMSWISLIDEIRAMRFILDHPEVSGPVNLTAPHPVTNAAFTKALGTALGRPTFLRIPKMVRRAPFGLGSLVDTLLFSSARVEPAALTHAGFSFHHAYVASALEEAIGDR